MMYESIKSFGDQFKWTPILENAAKLGFYDKFIVAGMGGSHLAADILKRLKSDLNIKVNMDYGLPAWGQTLATKVLVIASSHSGETEETILAYEEAVRAGYDVAVIASGGKLLNLAKENGRPYIELPQDNIQPRMAIGYSLLALLTLTRQTELLKSLSALAITLKPADFETLGQDIANRVKGKIPVIYSSYHNRSLAYIWKINLNETGKSPAFSNALPEMNHNELSGWDLSEKEMEFKKLFHFVLLRDATDHPRVIRRLELTKNLLESKGLAVETVDCIGQTEPEKIFNSIIVSAWLAYHLALSNDKETEQVPLIEKFKQDLVG